MGGWDGSEMPCTINSLVTCSFCGLVPLEDASLLTRASPQVLRNEGDESLPHSVQCLPAVPPH